MKTLAAALFLLSTTALAGPQLTLPGEGYDAQAVNLRNGQTALALVVDGGQARLQRVRVRVDVVKAVAGDDPQGNLGRKVSAAGVQPLLFITGVDGLRAGPLPVALSEEQPLSAQVELPFALKTTQYRLVTRCRPVDDAFRCQVSLDSSAGSQVLFDESGEKVGDAPADFRSDGPSLLFAGDLDGDGRVDLLIDTSDSKLMSRPTLYLSGAAKDGEQVHEVASQLVLGC